MMRSFEQIAADEGWTPATQVCVLLRFIQECQGVDFWDYLDNQVQDCRATDGSVLDGEG